MIFGRRRAPEERREGMTKKLEHELETCFKSKGVRYSRMEIKVLTCTVNIRIINPDELKPLLKGR